MKKIIFLLLLSSSLIYGVPGKGMGNREGRVKGFPFIDRFILKEIGVDDNTIQEIINMAIDIRTQVLDLQGQIRKSQLELQLELEKPNYDRKKINDLIRNIVDLRARQQYILESRKFRILERLAPDQRKKLFEYIEKRRNAFWGRMMKDMDDEVNNNQNNVNQDNVSK